MKRVKEPWGPEAAGSAWTKVVEPAPGELRLVQAFLNTRDLASGVDEIADPAALGAWLERWGLVEDAGELGAEEHRQAVALRGALRRMLPAHRRGKTDSKAVASLDRLAAGLPLRLRFMGGKNRLEPAADGFARAIGRILVLVAEAQRQNRFSRLKLCGSDTCRRVFYDYGPNRTGRWCRRRCGDRLLKRAWRRRNPRKRFRHV